MKKMTRTTALLASLPMLGLALSSPAQQQGPSDLSLVCPGTGQHLESHSSYGSEWDSKKHKYVDADRTSLDTTDVHGTVQIEIRSGQGRIHPPTRLVPPIASGGRDGWWPLTDLDISPDTIRARYRLNGLNKPQVTIDRRTGHITLEGVEDFEGDCTAVDPDARKF